MGRGRKMYVRFWSEKDIFVAFWKLSLIKASWKSRVGLGCGAVKRKDKCAFYTFLKLLTFLLYLLSALSLWCHVFGFLEVGRMKASFSSTSLYCWKALFRTHPERWPRCIQGAGNCSGQMRKRKCERRILAGQDPLQWVPLTVADPEWRREVWQKESTVNVASPVVSKKDFFRWILL